MEKPNYRTNLALIQSLYPEQATLTVDDVCRVLGCSRNTVYAYIRRVKDPLPCKHMSKRKIVVPVASLANWLS